MAESITIKALQDASLDAKSLEEVVNGNDTKQVTTRLGESYPSVKKAIKTLFENGGLPATPFATKALMTASILADGKYAVVTNDAIQKNNGLYLKTAGSWVKSDYDPVEQSNLDAASKYSPIPYAWNKVDLGTTTNESISNIGVVTGSPGYTLSGYIPVTKGDIFVLHNIKETGPVAFRASFTLFDDSKDLVGILVGGRTTLNETSSKNDKLLLNINEENKLELGKNSGVIIPQDGFIKVGFINSTDTKLYKTDFKGLTANTLTYIAKDSFFKFKGLMQSAVMDLSFNGLGISNSVITTGGKVVGNTAGNLASIKYAVKKGQYVSLHTAKNLAGDYNVWLVNAADDYISTLDKFNELTYVKDGGGVFYSNLLVPEDGFIRVQGHLYSHTTPLLAIHDEPIQVTRRTVKDKMSVEFYDDWFQRDTNPQSPALSNPIWSNYKNKSTKDTETMAASKSYLLKAGDVLEYSLAATIDAGAFLVMPVNGEYSTSGAYPNDIVQMIINESMDLYTTGKDVLLNKSLIYSGNAKGGSVAYCNEDIDTVIVFLRPRKQSSYFNLHNSSKDYSVRVYSKEDYIPIRNAGLKERFKKLSKYRADANTGALKATELGSDTYDYSGSYPSVLLFKGEVLQCITGSRVVPFATSLVKDVNGVVKKRLTNHSVYSTGYFSGTHRLPIKADDENSYNHAQIYAKETANVIVSFSILNDLGETLDVDGLISSQSFEPVIMPLADAFVGGNLTPTLIRGVSTSIITSGMLSSLLVGYRDSLVSFIPAGTYIEYSLWVDLVNTNAFYVPLSKPSTTLYQFGYPDTSEWKKVRVLGPKQGDTTTPELQVGSYNTSLKMGHYFDEDVLVAVTSKRADAPISAYELETYDPVVVNNLVPKITEVDTAYFVAHKKMLAINYSHTLRNITENDYSDLYRVTDETYIHIVNTEGLSFNFCEVTSTSLTVAYWSVLQILQEGKVIAVLNCKTENQGQSSASDLRKNVNMEFYNKDYEDVYIKFGDNIPEAELVLKSYLNSDKGHFKDTVSCELWHDIRTVEPYPVGGVFPLEVFYDTTTPTNQMAKGTPFGFPTENRKAGNFYGLATVRSKKKRENYAMDKDNREHILIQPDFIYVGTLNWSDIKLANFEVRNPKMKGYTEGDANLPAAYADVEANLRRLIEWMQGVHTKTIDLASTYRDFIDLDSFIDYIISINVLNHWDSMINNFLLGTHDGKIWRTYFYDADRTWGGIQGVISGYRVITINLYKSLFRDIADTFPDKVKQRYKFLRDKKVLNISRQQDRILRVSNNINPVSKKLDELWWGKIDEGAQAPYSILWYYHRINYMDIYYDYVAEPSIVLQNYYTLGDILAGANKSVTLTASKVNIGDVLSIVYGEASKDLLITYSITEVGKVNVTFKNLSTETLTKPASYLNIRKV